MNSVRSAISTRPRPREPHLSPAGWRVLVPGLPQWSWGQHDRALTFFLLHLGAATIGLFFWGTWLSLLMLAFAFAAHAASAADAIKQAAFPNFGRMVPLWAATLGLGATCYGPVMVLGSMFAWPVGVEHSPRDGYWVNRWAYRGLESPRHGETVWLRGRPAWGPRLARVLAVEGDQVRWAANRLHVGDRPAAAATDAADGPSHALLLTVPEAHVLVSIHDDLDELCGDLSRWAIVAHDEVHGRAWAQSYPVWNRQLLR